MADTLPAAGSTTSYVNPAYYTDTAAGVAGGVQGMLGDQGYLNNVSNNWYGTQPGQGVGQGALGAYSQYNPQQQQQFMNPYTEGAANEVMRLSNQNLTENVLPQVNSTFTGAGQFGSSRNADFTNRAIRDNQTALGGALSTMYKNAADTANTQYKDWTQMGTNASQQDFTNWLQQANFPISALAQMGQTTANIKPGTPSSVSTQAAEPTAWERAIMALGAAGNSLTPGSTYQGVPGGSLDSILNMIGVGGSAPTA